MEPTPKRKGRQSARKTTSIVQTEEELARYYEQIAMIKADLTFKSNDSDEDKDSKLSVLQALKVLILLNVGDVQQDVLIILNETDEEWIKTEIYNYIHEYIVQMICEGDIHEFVAFFSLWKSFDNNKILEIMQRTIGQLEFKTVNEFLTDCILPSILGSQGLSMEKRRVAADIAVVLARYLNADKLSETLAKNFVLKFISGLEKLSQEDQELSKKFAEFLLEYVRLHILSPKLENIRKIILGNNVLLHTFVNHIKNFLLIKIIESENNLENLISVFSYWKQYSTLPKFSEVLKDVLKKKSNILICKTFYLEVLISKVMQPPNAEFKPQTRDVLIDIAFEFPAFLPVSWWDTQEYDKLLQNVTGETGYIKNIAALVANNYQNWNKLWMFLVRIFGKKLHKNMVVINSLLSIAEKAFRNAEVSERLKGYDCWKELIDNVALDKNYIISSKQIKLLVTPLRAKFSRQESVIVKRFEVFVYLLEKLQGNGVLVLKEFLEFCFGEVGENTDPSKAGGGKTVPQLWIKSSKVLMAILGHCHREKDHCFGPDDVIKLQNRIVTQSNIASHYYYILNSVAECSKLLKEIELDGNRHTILDCLWRSTMNTVLSSQSEKRPQFLTLFGKILDDLLKDDSPYDNSIASIIFKVAMSMDPGKIADFITKNLTHILKIIFTVPLHEHSSTIEVEKLCVVLFNTQESEQRQQIKKIVFDAFTHYKTCENNVSYVAEIWVNLASELENYTRGKSLDYLLWPALHLSYLEPSSKIKLDLTESYRVLAKCHVEKQKELYIGLVNGFEKVLKNNPLLAPNIVTLMEMFNKNFENIEIINHTLKLFSQILILPNIEEVNDPHTIKNIELFLKECLNAPESAKVDDSETIKNVCKCLEYLFKNKRFSCAEDLEKFIRKLSENNLFLFSKCLSVDFFMDIFQKEQDLNITNQIYKIVDVLRNVKDPSLKNVKSSFPMSGRSAKIANLVKKLPNSDKVESSSAGLRLFGKDVETLTPIKVKGSILKNTPKTPISSTTNKRNNTPNKFSSPSIKSSIMDESTSEFVPINTEVKIKPDMLTEHQKETLKRRREDIPALYEDLSQSQSQSITSLVESKKLLKSPDVANKDDVKETINNLQTFSNIEVIEESSNATSKTKNVVEYSENIFTETEDSIKIKNLQVENAVTENVLLEDKDETSKKQIKMQAELKKLQMNIVGADEFLTPGRAKRIRKSLLPDKKEEEDNKKTSNKKVQEDSTVKKDEQKNEKKGRKKKQTDSETQSSETDKEVQTNMAVQVDTPFLVEDEKKSPNTAQESVLETQGDMFSEGPDSTSVKVSDQETPSTIVIDNEANEEKNTKKSKRSIGKSNLECVYDSQSTPLNSEKNRNSADNCPVDTLEISAKRRKSNVRNQKKEKTQKPDTLNSPNQSSANDVALKEKESKDKDENDVQHEKTKQNRVRGRAAKSKESPLVVKGTKQDITRDNFEKNISKESTAENHFLEKRTGSPKETTARAGRKSKGVDSPVTQEDLIHNDKKSNRNARSINGSPTASPVEKRSSRRFAESPLARENLKAVKEISFEDQKVQEVITQEEKTNSKGSNKSKTLKVDVESIDKHGTPFSNISKRSRMIQSMAVKKDNDKNKAFDSSADNEPSKKSKSIFSSAKNTEITEEDDKKADDSDINTDDSDIKSNVETENTSTEKNIDAKYQNKKKRKRTASESDSEDMIESSQESITPLNSLKSINLSRISGFLLNGSKDNSLNQSDSSKSKQNQSGVVSKDQEISQAEFNESIATSFKSKSEEETSVKKSKLASSKSEKLNKSKTDAPESPRRSSRPKSPNKIKSFSNKDTLLLEKSSIKKTNCIQRDLKVYLEIMDTKTQEKEYEIINEKIERQMEEIHEGNNKVETNQKHLSKDCPMQETETENSQTEDSETQDTQTQDTQTQDTQTQDTQTQDTQTQETQDSEKDTESLDINSSNLQQITDDSPACLQLDLPERPELTDSEKITARMDTETLTESDFKDISISSQDTIEGDKTTVNPGEIAPVEKRENENKSEIDQNLEHKSSMLDSTKVNLEKSAPEEDLSISESNIDEDKRKEENNIQTNGNEVIDETQEAHIESPGRSGILNTSVELPSSPVTGDTPNRTSELLNSTSDISPIGSKSSLSFDEDEITTNRRIAVALKFDDDDPDHPSSEKSPEKGDDAPPKRDADISPEKSETINQEKIEQLKENTEEVKQMQEEDVAMAIITEKTDIASHIKVTQEEKSISERSTKLFELVKEGSVTHRLIKKRKSSGPTMSPSASRIKKLMSNMKCATPTAAVEDLNKEDILTFSREVPSPLAVPRSSILKRKHPEFDESGYSPVTKRKRVNFSDPCTTSRKVFIKDDNHAANVLDAENIALHRELFGEISEEQETEEPSTELSLQMTNATVLRNNQAIYPDLIDCQVDVTIIVKKVTSPMFVNNLLLKLKNKGITTIGDLANLSEAEVNRYPFKTPVVTNVYRALDEYYLKSGSTSSCGTGRSSIDSVKEGRLSKELKKMSPRKKLSLFKEPSEAEDKEKSEDEMTIEQLGDIVISALETKKILDRVKGRVNLQIQDIIDQNKYPDALKEIVKTLGLSKVFDILATVINSEIDQEKVYYDRIVTDSSKQPLGRFIKGRDLNEVEKSLWSCVEDGTFAKQELITTVFVPHITTPDLDPVFDRLTTVDIENVALTRLKGEELNSFVIRIIEKYPSNSTQIINKINVEQIPPADAISLVSRLLNNGLLKPEHLVEVFHLVSNAIGSSLRPTAHMDLAIEFMKTVPLRE